MEPQKGFQMFQTDSNNHYQTPGVGVVLQQAPEKRIKKVLLEKSHSDPITINLSKVILLDIQSTMDLIWNEYMVERIYKSKNKMRLRSNGGKMVIDQKAVVEGYIKDVWFYNTAITNIFSLKNLIHQYRVTYDILDQMFIVHHEENNNPNMHFIMYESGLQYYDPAEYFTFVTTVSDNNKQYSKR